MKADTTKEITVEFDGKKCIHARRCVLGLPEVFQPGTKGSWIFPENAQAEEVARLVDVCPSGALSYHRTDGGMEEQAPQVNSARLWENGPIEFHADFRIPDEEPQTRALICRCGHSKNKPFCDNSHIDANFVASGDLPTTDNVETLDVRDGVLDVTPLKDGPLMVTGNLEVIAGSGRRLATGQKHAMCRCGASQNKPFCDGSHTKIGFKAD